MSTNETVESGIEDEDYFSMLTRSLNGEITVERILLFPITQPAYTADRNDYSYCVAELHRKRAAQALGYISAKFEFYYALHDHEFIGGHSQD